MNARRLYGPVVLATLATGGLGFWAASRPWATTVLSTEGLAPTDLSVSGTDAEPLVSAFAVVVVTAALALLAAGPRLRQVVGVLTMLVGLGGILVAPRPGSAGIDHAVTKAAEASPAFTGPESIGSVSSTWWYFVAVFAFAVAIVLGAAMVRWARAWPTMGSRYDAPGARPKPAKPEKDADMWKAMDEGHDPTQ